MKNVPVKLAVAATIALAVAIYFINGKSEDVQKSQTDNSTLNETHGQHVQAKQSKIEQSKTDTAANDVPAESSAVSGVVSSRWTDSNGVTHYADEAAGAHEQTNQGANQEGTLPESVQETIRQRRAGSQNSGVDKDKTDAAAGAASAYKAAEGKSDK